MKPLLAVAMLVWGMSAGVWAEDKPADAPDAKAIEQMMMEMAKVEPHHEVFKKSVGEWTTKSTYYTMGADKPQVSNGTAKMELMMGGRFLKQTFTGDYYGMPYEGMGLSGYDNAQKKYTGTWIDNFGTGMMQFEGTLDKKTGVMTEIGTIIMPTGPMKMKMVTKHEGDDAMTLTMYMLGPGGSETKHMVIEYARQK